LPAACAGDSSSPRDGVGSSGGELDLPDGAKIIVPAGAVSSGVEIHAATTNEQLAAPPPGHERVGPAYVFTPHGTAFSRPVVIDIPRKATHGQVFVLANEGATEWEPAPEQTTKNDAYEVTTMHISIFAELATSTDTADASSQMDASIASGGSSHGSGGIGVDHGTSGAGGRSGSNGTSAAGGLSGYPGSPMDASSDAASGSVRDGSASDAASGSVSDAASPIIATDIDAPSCKGLAANCGPKQDESCCRTIRVPGGTFLRWYDNDWYKDKSYPATISPFRLDKYMITVGRFRKFVDAVVAGWSPATGSGKHTHLNGGHGLANNNYGQGLATNAVDGGRSYEWGWDPTAPPQMPKTKADWDVHLVVPSAAAPGPSSPYATWTSAPGKNERRPLNLIARTDAYAFCIWDGGFLPSEAEWDFAAQGGSEQRTYAWGSTPPGPGTEYMIYGCHYDPLDAGAGGLGNRGCTGFRNIAPVGSAPAGNGRWGHADLAGNLWEWTLDSDEGVLRNPCDDCVFSLRWYEIVAPLSDGYVVHGGTDFENGDNRTTTRFSENGGGSEFVGARCARSP
jgi:formylglycine-generating enzyme required for sulfatase activity